MYEDSLMLFDGHELYQESYFYKNKINNDDNNNDNDVMAK